MRGVPGNANASLRWSTPHPTSLREATFSRKGEKEEALQSQTGERCNEAADGSEMGE
ncbi:hypothetical protein MesoLj131b_09190 [Mesorhizobium sp. 131-2-5]|nr:hypothetical protein MesoLj131b_09190 [Mesorhizobium sp. 131-2-5]